LNIALLRWTGKTMNAATNTKTRQKKQYAKPRLRRIRLSAGEVLITGCKTSYGGEAFGNVPCTAGSCSGDGS